MILNIVLISRLSYSIIKRCFWQKFSEDAIRDFNNIGYIFNHIAEMNIITIANKLDKYDFYIKHNMHAVEWKLNAMINEDKNLMKKIN